VIVSEISALLCSLRCLPIHECYSIFSTESMPLFALDYYFKLIVAGGA
jgi:hypothetical protein